MTQPLFSDEGPAFYNAAYQHNAPYAKPGPYMTRLPPAPEKQYRRWVKDNNIATNPDEKVSDYDMRGFWLAIQRGQAQMGREPDGSPGFDDRWKTPYDTTFSRESMYAKPDCPFVWQGDNLVDMRDGQLIFSRDPRQPTLAPTDKPRRFDSGGHVGDEEDEGRRSGMAPFPGHGHFEPVQPAPPMFGGAPLGKGPKAPAREPAPRADQYTTIPTQAARQYLQFNDRPAEPPITKEFINDIRQNGIKTPIEIRTDGERAYVFDGMHRLEAAVELGIPNVPVRIRYLPRDLGPDYWPHPVEGYSHPLEPFVREQLRGAEQQIAPTDMPDAPGKKFDPTIPGATMPGFDQGGGVLDQNVGDPDYWPPGASGDMVRATPHRDPMPGAYATGRTPYFGEPDLPGTDRLPDGRITQQTGYGSGHGTRWHLEVVHANGQVSPLPLRKTGGGSSHTNWTSDYQLQPGDQIRCVKHG